MRHPTRPFTPLTPPIVPSPHLAETVFPSGIFFTTNQASSPKDGYSGVEADEKAFDPPALPVGLLDDEAPALRKAQTLCFPEQHRPAVARPVVHAFPSHPPSHLRQQSQPAIHLGQRSQPIYRSPPIFIPHSRPDVRQPAPTPQPLGPAFVAYTRTAHGVVADPPRQHNNSSYPPVWHPPQPIPRYFSRPLPWPPGASSEFYQPKNDVRPRPLPSSQPARPPLPPKAPLMTAAPAVQLNSASPSIGPVDSPALAPTAPAPRSPPEPVVGPPPGLHPPRSDTVAGRIEATARSGAFLRECQRLARDFIACAEVVRIGTLEDHAAALATLVTLGELHGAVLQKLALGDFKGVMDVLPCSTATEVPASTSKLSKSDSSGSNSLPSLSTSSSTTNFESVTATTPARNGGNSTGDMPNRSDPEMSPVVALSFPSTGPAVPRWVSRRAGQGPSDGASVAPALTTDPQPFFRLLLNCTTPSSATRDSRILTNFILRSLADPTGYKLAPLTVFVKTVVEHVTKVTAGPTAARSFSRSAATLLRDIHLTASAHGKTSVPALLLHAVQPYLDALVDKVFPPLSAAQAGPSRRLSDARANRLDDCLPQLAVFLCFVHAIEPTLVPSSILYEFLHLLLRTPEPTERECFAACEIFDLAGQRLERENAQGRAQIEAGAKWMKVIAHNARLSARARFALQDMIDLRAHGWMSRAWMRRLRGRVEY